ncbi:MAG TPA: hypothetical protein VMU89_23680 [Thermomicrobiaceae bacterium]|nr:hypothetical protein [Thermomicrobiaceae bacterium]
MGRVTRRLLAVLLALVLVTLAPLWADASARPRAADGPSLTITEPIPGPNHAEALIAGAGFHPRSAVVVTLYPPSTPPYGTTTRADAHGTFSVTFGVYMYACGTTIPVSANDSKGDAATGSITIQC